MILQNNSGENKVFIDDSILNNCDITIINDPVNDNVELVKKDGSKFNFSINGEIFLDNLSSLMYDIITDTITFLDLEYNDFGENWSCIGYKNIQSDEIVSISLSTKLDESDNDTVIISTMKLPKFLSQDNYDDKYPKFEVNLSDCTYGMKIYINDSEYIAIPDFQSHNNIHSTLDYIAQLVFYLTEGRPGFFEKLCNSKSIEILIKDKGCEKFAYVLGEEGIFLTGGELEDYLVEWQKFFKLVMDGKWEVDFE